ncbi:MAG: hypothetical protein KFB97_03810 [Cyanobium sp. M30B3]|nr:MAG: hypothetical protein KFB97_03810 [Cyanobium sp. M30B3]
MDAWRTVNPHFSYSLFNRCSAASALEDLYGESLRDAFLSIRLPAMQADVFRVAYLYACSGVWIDAATHCLGPLHSWLDPESPLVLLRKPTMVPPLVCNGFIYAATSRHPFLGEALKRITAVIEARYGDGFWKLVGAGMFRDVLSEANFSAGVTILDLDSVCAFIQFGSSSEAMGPNSHWSVRQKRASLYFG